MLVRDLVRRYPDAAEILARYGVDAAQTHLSIEFAAEASQRDPKPLLTSLRESLLDDRSAA